MKRTNFNKNKILYRKGFTFLYFYLKVYLTMINIVGIIYYGIRVVDVVLKELDNMEIYNGLISNFISAIHSFSRKICFQELEYITLEKLCLYFHSAALPFNYTNDKGKEPEILLGYVIIEKQEENIEQYRESILPKLERMLEEFLKNYPRIKNFNNIAFFHPFKEKIKSIFNNTEILLEKS